MAAALRVTGAVCVIGQRRADEDAGSVQAEPGPRRLRVTQQGDGRERRQAGPAEDGAEQV